MIRIVAIWRVKKSSKKYVKYCMRYIYGLSRSTRGVWEMSSKLLVFRMGNYPWRRMNHKWTNGMKMWKGNGNTTTLLLSLIGLETVHQERRGQVKTIVMEHLNGILLQSPDLLTSSIPTTNQIKKVSNLNLAQIMCSTLIRMMGWLCGRNSENSLTLFTIARLWRFS